MPPSAFAPDPHDRIRIGGVDYVVPPHPASAWAAYGNATGRKATVYQLLRLYDSRPFALKVFKEAFRGAYVEELSTRIAKYTKLPGMRACEREVLNRRDHRNSISQYPDLEFAVLMPWIKGLTWGEIIQTRHAIDSELSLKLATSAAKVFSSLEQNGLAHCDVSGGNVLIENEEVVLVDLEDLFAPDLGVPSAVSIGTDGYRHAQAPNRPAGQWGPCGDRFTAAVLIAEILGWHDLRVRKMSEREHYFPVDHMHRTDVDSYRLLRKVLAGTSKDLADFFTRAWTAPTLEDCPKLGDWARCIAEALLIADLKEAAKQGDYREIHRLLLEYRQTRGDAEIDALPLTKKQNKRIKEAVDLHDTVDALTKAAAVKRVATVVGMSAKYQNHRSSSLVSADLRNEIDRMVAAHAALEAALVQGDDVEIERRWSEPDLDWTAAINSKQETRVDLACRRMAAYRTLVRAEERHDDRQVATILDQKEKLLRGTGLVEDSRAQLARDRVEALDELENLIAGGEGAAIWEHGRTHWSLLAPSASFTAHQRDRIRMAQIEILRRALRFTDAEFLEQNCEPPLFREPGAMESAEVEQIEESLARQAALAALQTAIAGGEAAKIVAAHSDHAVLLRRSAGYRARHRARVRAATQEVVAEALEEAIRSGYEHRIVETANRAAATGCRFDAAVRGRVRKARRALGALRRLEQAVTNGSDREIVFRYDPALFDDSPSMSPELRKRVALAQAGLLQEMT